jgi:hypothetical protein
VTVEDATNILNSATFIRDDNECNVIINWEIIEYTGEPGGPNEIIVRQQAEINSAGQSSVTGAVVSVEDDDAVAVFITGQRMDGNFPNRVDRVIHIAAWNSDIGAASFTRSDGDGSAYISYAVVEWAGSNWRDVQYVTNTLGGGDSTTNSTITAVNTNKTFFHTQVRSGSTRLDEHGVSVVFASNSELTFQRSATASARQVYAVWLIENIAGGHGEMIVNHYSGSRASNNDPGPITWTNSITAVSDISNASIMGEQCIIDDGSFPVLVPIGSINVELASTNEVEFFSVNDKYDKSYTWSVVQWPFVQRVVMNKGKVTLVGGKVWITEQ